MKHLSIQFGASQASHVKHRRRCLGMTLAEILGALLVGAMVLAAVLGLYIRVVHAAETMTEQLDRSDLPAEVLQLIAEDLDKIVATGTAVQIRLSTKPDAGFSLTQLQILRKIQDEGNKERDIEQITWQTALDPATNRLTLYRAHEGEILEDRVLQKNMSRLRKAYPFVPICSGLSVFRMEVPQGESARDTWTETSLPPGLRLTLSFANPEETPQGIISVDEEEEVVRTIAIDRTRAIRFEVPDANDPNNLDATETPPEASAPSLEVDSTRSGSGSGSTTKPRSRRR